MESCNSNSRKFWRILKPNQKTVLNAPSSKDFYQHYFDLYARNSNNCYDPIWRQYVNSYISNLDNDFCSNNFDIDITINELWTVVKRLKSNKAPGPDGILNEFIKNSFEFIGLVLVNFFNIIFRRGVYPETWTKSKLISIHKKGDKTNPSNYRGISLVSVFAKLFESIILARIENWYIGKNIIDKGQFAYNGSQSTIEAMFTLFLSIR